MKKSTDLKKFPRQKKCKSCKENFTQYNPLQTKCKDCQIKEFYSHKKHKCKPLKEIKPKKKRIKSENNKNKDLAWNWFSKYIRLRDCLKTTKTKDMGVCYTCDKTIPFKASQAGHGISGRGNAILLDEDVVKLQCEQCNIYKSGNYEIFVSKLIKEHGLKWYQDKLALKHTTVKKDWEFERDKWKAKYFELLYGKPKKLPF